MLFEAPPLLPIYKDFWRGWRLLSDPEEGEAIMNLNDVVN
jgi:hypothetical protein